VPNNGLDDDRSAVISLAVSVSLIDGLIDGLIEKAHNDNNIRALVLPVPA
jgi:hypothetical protein